MLSFGDALVTLPSSSFVLWQIFVLRSAMALLALMVAWQAGFLRLVAGARDVFWGLVRSLLLVAMWVSYYAALPHLDLALAAAWPGRANRRELRRPKATHTTKPLENLRLTIVPRNRRLGQRGSAAAGPTNGGTTASQNGYGLGVRSRTTQRLAEDPG